MKRNGPSAWMELLLLSLLPSRDRETIAGDLHEEFCERSASEQNPLRVRFWYLLQTISFAPPRFRSAFIQPRALALLCAFTALCGCWLGAMDVRLRHPGWPGQASIAATILLQALLTLVALKYRRRHSLRHLSIFGCLVLLALAAKALIGAIHVAHLEGYVLLIAVALVYQAFLTFCTLRRVDQSGRIV